VKGRADVGLNGGGAANQAYAEENLFEWQRAVDNSMSDILETENRLRRLTGMPINDGQLLTPTVPPCLGQVIPDWNGVVNTALCNRIELRQQQLRIKSLTLQCLAAGSLTHPQFDVVAGAQLNGTGDELIEDNSGAFNSLIDTDDAGWNVGFEFSMPLGFRLAKARKQNMEFRLAKARAALDVQQSEVSHELAHVFHELDRTYAAMGTAAGRRDAALRRFSAVEADYNAGRSDLDLLLRTRVAVAEAERAYLETVVAYNKTLVDLCYRQGIVLQENAVAIVE
jgi:outer membrane protein TolC